MTLGAGEVFAGYTIIRPLGAGGMGEVYLAEHPRLPRREALKILRSDIVAGDSSFRARFIREADSIASLEHPNIVTVHDRGEIDGRLWIATQYVDGADGAQLLRDRYPVGMPAEEVAAITTAIAQALDYAHSRGILHRDVKPANVLIAHPDRGGPRRVYLADFGIARPLDDPAGLTSTNFTLGTFAYAAPEQLTGKAIDGRADQYALAATAFHLLTGTTVFPDSNPVAVISRHLTEPAPAPSTVSPALASFDAAFAKALAKDPNDRFPRCQDFALALTAAAAGNGPASPTAPTQQAPVPPALPNPRGGPRQSPAASAVIALIAVGLLIGGMALWRPWEQRRHESAPSAAPLPATTPAPAPPTGPPATRATPPPLVASSTPPPPRPPVVTAAAPTNPYVGPDSAHVQFFRSPSGNIHCQVSFQRAAPAAAGGGYLPDTAYCMSANPLQHVVLSPDGSLVGICTNEPRCGSNGPQDEGVLSYGQKAVLGPFTCLSEESGMTCMANGRGFTISTAGIAPI